MEKMKKLIVFAITLLCLSQAFAATNTNDENTNGVDRYAIYIGSNKGGKGREQLLQRICFQTEHRLFRLRYNRWRMCHPGIRDLRREPRDMVYQRQKYL